MPQDSLNLFSIKNNFINIFPKIQVHFICFFIVDRLLLSISVESNESNIHTKQFFFLSSLALPSHTRSSRPYNRTKERGNKTRRTTINIHTHTHTYTRRRPIIPFHTYFFIHFYRLLHRLPIVKISF